MAQVSAFAADISIKTAAQSSQDVDYKLLREHLDTAGFLLDASADDLPDRVSNSGLYSCDRRYVFEDDMHSDYHKRNDLSGFRER